MNAGVAQLAEIILWGSLAALFYIYAGYPLLIACLACCRPRPVKQAPFQGSFSVVLSAYNEAPHLADKLRNLLALDNAGQLLEILVGSDGSTDATNEQLRQAQDQRIRPYVFSGRRGKASVLNDLIPQCRSDVVVLVDARQKIAPGAVAALLENFADPEVAAVSGELVFRPEGLDTATAQGADAYWRYEKFIRRQEALFKSVPGATGALYAIKKTAFRPIPADTLVDDVLIPMQAIMAGGRCVFASGALVYDQAAQGRAREAVRKRRTIAGVIQLLGRYPRWLWPGHNPIWLSYFSHKIARLFSPWLLLAALVGNVVLWDGIYGVVLIMHTVAYGMGILGCLGFRGNRLFSAAAAFLQMNGVTVLAWRDWITGCTAGAWRKSDEIS